jgi:hypothetical protein
MTFKRRSYEETRDSVIRHITEGVVNERHGYRRGRNSYVLGYPSAKKIEKLEGYVDGEEATFAEGTDYRLNQGRVEWLPEGAKPDIDTAFEVFYSIGEARVLTDA